MDPIVSPDFIAVDVDVFNYYSRLVAELWADDDDDGCRKDQSLIPTGSMLFANVISARLSDAKRERLKSLLRQSVFVLTPQVDQMLERVIKIRDWQLLLRSNQQQETCPDATSDDDLGECPLKKQRRSSSASLSSSSAHESPARDEPNGQEEDFLFYLKQDSSTVEVMLKQVTDEQSAQLGSMRQRLEAMLDAVMSRCRLMTSSEKEQLRKRVVKLPEENLGRALEILGHGKGSDAESHDEIFEDLEKVDNVTLWRLYYYVEALKNADKLGSGVTSLLSLTGKHT